MIGFFVLWRARYHEARDLTPRARAVRAAPPHRERDGALPNDASRCLPWRFGGCRRSRRRAPACCAKIPIWPRCHGSNPEDQLIALRRQNKDAAAAAPIATGVDISNLNFRYAIQGDKPAWRPLRAFDDGQKVYIEFPTGIRQGEMPPLFVIGPAGGSELVNYRVRQNYYVVDRLFAAAELRLGDNDSERRVRIVRTDGVRSGPFSWMRKLSGASQGTNPRSVSEGPAGHRREARIQLPFESRRRSSSNHQGL